MNLETPLKIRTLQRKLYCKAKVDPTFRSTCSTIRIPAGSRESRAPGVDEITFAMIEAAGLETWLSDVRMDLAAKTYKAAPVRRAMIPKPGGGERPLGIPTIRDRVVQTAAKLVLEPIFEADLDCLRLSSEAERNERYQGSAPADLPALYRCGRCRPRQVLRYDPSR